MIDNKNSTSMSLNSHVMKGSAAGEVCVDAGHMTSQLSQVAFNPQACMADSKGEIKTSVFTLID